MKTTREILQEIDERSGTLVITRRGPVGDPNAWIARLSMSDATSFRFYMAATFDAALALAYAGLIVEDAAR